jgi:ABC-type glycerol-3-phosphate transport system substrate-binding protein
MRKRVVFLFCVSVFLSCIVGFIGCVRKQEKVTGITVWYWMTDRQDAFIELAEIYEKEKGIKINFELYAPSDAYTQKVMAAAQTNTLPDVYGILGEKRVFASFIKAGHVADLAEEMDAENGKWGGVFFSKALDVNRFLPDNQFGVKPGIYGVPIDVTNIQVLYNKALFRRAGLDPDRPPSTWKEFIEAGEMLRAAGIPVLVSGWGEIWLIDCFASNYAFNIMGKGKVIATIRGDVPYTDPDWIRVFTIFKQLSEKGLLAQGVVTMVNKIAEQIFANERAAFSFNGSWCVNVYKGMNPALEYGAMLPPKISEEHPMAIWGGAGSSFMVNAKSENKRDAMEFLKWLTDTKQQVFLAKSTQNLPSNKYSLTEIPPILAQFVDDMDRTTHPSILPVAEFPRVTEALDKGIQSIITGEKTPEQVAKEVQNVKEKEMKSQRLAR